MMVRNLFLFLVLVYCTSSVQALDIQFEQTAIQGALLYGTTDASSIEVLGKTVEVDDSGRFVFGVGRDAPSELELTLYGVLDEAQEETPSRNAGSHVAKEANSEPHAKGQRITRSVIIQIEQRRYDTQAITGVDKKYVSPPKSVTERIQRDSTKIKRARAIYTKDAYEYLSGFIWPAEGPVSGVYGSQRVFNGVPKRPHYGLDIAAPTGTPVVAPASGRVTLVDDDMYYSGGTLIIDHGRGVSSTFIHLSKIHVALGQYVEQGALIADIGATGRVTGAHLDWRINWFNERLDPALLLPERSPRD